MNNDNGNGKSVQRHGSSVQVNNECVHRHGSSVQVDNKCVQLLCDGPLRTAVLYSSHACTTTAREWLGAMGSTPSCALM